MIGWGFPCCTSSWLSCGCSFVKFFASSLSVPLVLGFSCWSLRDLLPRSNLRFPPRRGPSFGPRQLPFEFSELLLLPCHVHAFLVSLRWFAFYFSPSLPPVLLPSSCGPFLLGGSVILLFRRRFRSWYLLRPSVVFLRVVSLGLSSALFSVSTSFQQFLPGVVLVAFPSCVFLPWLDSFSLRLFSLARPCVLTSPLRWFLSRHLGFLFFLVSFSVSVSCPPWDSPLCCSSSTSFVTRSNLSSFATGSSLWAESLSVVAVVASLSVFSLGRLSPFVLGPCLLWLLPPWFRSFWWLFQCSFPVGKVLLCQLSYLGFLLTLHVLRLSA